MLVDPEAEPIVDGIEEVSCAISEIDAIYNCAKDVVT